ncbi:MAG: T9SS type A sorting domain-containing protein [Bacteroidales bacterium]|nr:T9SS type A sorting domain-containing protein [Bacteroidales bacterium]
MKRLLYRFVFVMAVTVAYSQTITTRPDLGQAWGAGTSVDINNDGYLDFYIAGAKNNPKEPLLDEEGNPLDLNQDGIPDTTERWQRMYFWNPETNQYENVVTSLRITDRPNLDWYDVDGDGLLDLLATEHSFGFYHGGVYKNLGNGLFQKLDIPVPVKANAGAWADFNNDGYIDFVVLSNDVGASGIYINQGDNTFVATNTDVFGEFSYGLAYCEVIDYNNDGFMDVFVTANCDNASAEINDGARVIADVFINYDEEPGNFYRAYLGKTANNTSGCIYMKGNGGVDFADINGDGWIDMVLHGEGGQGTFEPASGDVWTCISHVYINQKDGTFADKPQASFQADLRPLNSTGSGTAIIDWNNDGNFDLFITGWNPPTVNTQAGYLYTGDGAGNFTEVGRVPGASETVILLNDWNNDGFPDYLVSGHSWDDMFYPTEAEKGRTAALMLNPNASSVNNPPSAPAGLTATVNGSDVVLSWNEATDDKTPAKSLSYEYFLKDAQGNFLIAPASFVGGEKDGLRKVIKMGNACLNKFVKLRGLADGQYTWGVQAIDAMYKGSPFATGTFTVGSSGVVERKVSIAKIYASGNTLNIRTFSGDKMRLAVYNILGQPVLQEDFSGNFTRELPFGAYIVKVTSSGKVQTAKVVIE